jgi:hypothetical protein
MHQAYTRYMALWCPSAVQCALIQWFFVRVETELDHAEGHGTADEDVASAICVQSDTELKKRG